MRRMNHKIYYIFAVILVLAIASSFVTLRLFATNGPWVYLGKEDYELLSVRNSDYLLSPVRIGNYFIVFNALQDIDAKKITEARSGTMTDSGVEIIPKGKNIDMSWEEMREKKIIPALKFYAITPQNTLLELSKKDSFEIPLPFKNKGQTEKNLKLVRLHLNGKSILSSAEPEGFQLIYSPDATKYLIGDKRGLWLLEVDKNDLTKISTDTYNGKTYDELRDELVKYSRSKGIKGLWLWWNGGPIFSPDSSKIVYGTNRDCPTGGSSIWLYDLTTKEERPLIKSKSGEYYCCDRWIDAAHIIGHRGYRNDKILYFIVDTNGQIEYLNLNIKGKHPSVLSVSDQGLIAYTSNSSEMRDINVIKVGQDNSITTLYSRTIDGTLRLRSSELINPEGTKVAFLYAPDKDNTSRNRNLMIADLKSNKETIIERAPTKEEIEDFSWLNNNRLLIHTDKVTNGMHEISSWIYNVEGGKS